MHLSQTNRHTKVYNHAFRQRSSTERRWASVWHWELPKKKQVGLLYKRIVYSVGIPNDSHLLVLIRHFTKMGIRELHKRVFDKYGHGHTVWTATGIRTGVQQKLYYDTYRIRMRTSFTGEESIYHRDCTPSPCVFRGWSTGSYSLEGSNDTACTTLTEILCIIKRTTSNAWTGTWSYGGKVTSTVWSRKDMPYRVASRGTCRKQRHKLFSHSPSWWWRVWSKLYSNQSRGGILHMDSQANLNGPDNVREIQEKAPSWKADRTICHHSARSSHQGTLSCDLWGLEWIFHSLYSTEDLWSCRPVQNGFLCVDRHVLIFPQCF